jgi:hypothetical protein
MDQSVRIRIGETSFRLPSPPHVLLGPGSEAVVEAAGMSDLEPFAHNRHDFSNAEAKSLLTN